MDVVRTIVTQIKTDDARQLISQIAVNAALFAATLVSTIAFRKNEWTVFGVLSGLLLALFYVNDLGAMQALELCAFGVFMASAAFVCVWYGMLSYHFTKWPLPVWLPVAWAISGMCLLKFIEFRQRAMELVEPCLTVALAHVRKSPVCDKMISRLIRPT